MHVMLICSDQPCKTDADVIRALETARISPIDYPLVHQWRNNVLSYPEAVRSRLVAVHFFVEHLYHIMVANHTNCFVA